MAQRSDEHSSVPAGTEGEILRRELSQSLAEGSQCQNLYSTSTCDASENSSENLQLRHEREHVTVHSRNLETETPACQRAVRCLESQIAQIPHLKGMINVEGQKSNTPWTEVIHFETGTLQFSQKLDRSKAKVAQLQARCCTDFWHHLEPTQLREMSYLSQKLERIHTKERQHQHGSAATGGGGLGADDTTLIQRVEPSLSDAVGGRLPSHLSSSTITACPGDTRTAAQQFKEPETSGERPPQLPRKWKLKNLSSKPGLTSET